MLRSQGRTRPLLQVPTPIVSRGLRLLEATLGPRAFATWDEAELMEVSMLSERGAGDAERLGVAPQPMGAVLGAAEPARPRRSRLRAGGAAPPTAAPLRPARERQQRRLAGRTPDELDAERQPVLALEQRQRDRRAGRRR